MELFAQKFFQTINFFFNIYSMEKEEKEKKDYINKSILNEPKTGVLFCDFIEKTIEKKSKRFGENYKKNYQTLIHHINNFSNTNNANIYTNSVNEDFIDDFIVYLEDLDLKKSYIKTLLSLIKAMAKKASFYGYAIDSSYDDVDIADDNFFSVFLSMNEITRIYYFKGLTKKQERIKDLFIWKLKTHTSLVGGTLEKKRL